MLECPNQGESISGLISEIQLKSSGSATLKGTITVSEPGPCSYAFKNPKATFAPPGFLWFEGKATGKLAKGSAKSCAKTFVVDVTDEGLRGTEQRRTDVTVTLLTV